MSIVAICCLAIEADFLWQCQSQCGETFVFTSRPPLLFVIDAGVPTLSQWVDYQSK